MKYIFVTVFIVISALFCYYIYTNYHFGVPTEKYTDPQRNDLPIMKHSTVNLVKRLNSLPRSFQEARSLISIHILGRDFLMW